MARRVRKSVGDPYEHFEKVEWKEWNAYEKAARQAEVDDLLDRTTLKQDYADYAKAKTEPGFIESRNEAGEVVAWRSDHQIGGDFSIASRLKHVEDRDVTVKPAAPQIIDMSGPKADAGIGGLVADTWLGTRSASRVLRTGSRTIQRQKSTVREVNPADEFSGESHSPFSTSEELDDFTASMFTARSSRSVPVRTSTLSKSFAISSVTARQTTPQASGLRFGQSTRVTPEQWQDTPQAQKQDEGTSTRVIPRMITGQTTGQTTRTRTETVTDAFSSTRATERPSRPFKPALPVPSFDLGGRSGSAPRERDVFSGRRWENPVGLYDPNIRPGKNPFSSSKPKANRADRLLRDASPQNLHMVRTPGKMPRAKPMPSLGIDSGRKTGKKGKKGKQRFSLW